MREFFPSFFFQYPKTSAKGLCNADLELDLNTYLVSDIEIWRKCICMFFLSFFLMYPLTLSWNQYVCSNVCWFEDGEGILKMIVWLSVSGEKSQVKLRRRISPTRSFLYFNDVESFLDIVPLSGIFQKGLASCTHHLLK